MIRGTALKRASAATRAPWMAVLLWCAFLPAASAEGAPESAARPDYRLPAIDVQGAHLTLEELIDLAARAVERSQRLDEPHRYTRHIRFIVFYGDSTDARRRRQVCEEVSRVAVGPGHTLDIVHLSMRLEEWRGDSLASVRQDEKGVEAFAAQFEQYSGLASSLRGSGYRFHVLERRPLRDRALLHLAYEPQEEFASLPRGEAWLDTRDYVALRQTGSLRRNVPMPMFLKEVEWFRLGCRAFGPLWIQDDTAVTLNFRRSGRGFPRRLEYQQRIYDLKFDELSGAVVSILDRPDPGELRIRGILDSLAAADTAAVDAALLLPPRLDLVRAVTRGDSLLARELHGRHLRLLSWRPRVRYDRVERLYGGLGAKGMTRGGHLGMGVEAGYAMALRHVLGQVDLEPVTGREGDGRRLGAHLRAETGVATFGADPLPLQAAFTLAGHRDPMDYYGIREARIEPWVAAGAGTRVTLSLRSSEQRVLRTHSLWTLRGRIHDDSLLAIDPGRIHAAGVKLEIGMRTPREAPALSMSWETAGRELGGDFRFNKATAAFALRHRLSGGLRATGRARCLASTKGLPRQDQLYLGGIGSLRAYPGETLTGRSGYHIGGELFLNRDIVGWLPWVPDRGLGLEALIAADHGGTLASTRVKGRPADGRAFRTSAGVGFARVLGLPGLYRMGLSVHAGIGRGDHAWAIQLLME